MFRRSRRFVLLRILLRLSTKARFSESCGSCAATNHVFDRQLRTMILSPNSPLGFKGRQGAQSTSRWSFLHHRLTRATLHASRRFAAELLHAASSTAVPPTFVRELLWRPHYDHGEILTADNIASILDRIGRLSGRPGPANSASSELPCLLIAPSRCFPPLLSSLGFKPR